MRIENALPLNDVRNPRDLGGLIGADKRPVKFKRLLRTGRIYQLQAHDQQFLLDYGVRQVVDLRSKAEQAKEPDSKLAGVEHFSLSVTSNDGSNSQASLEELNRLYDRDPLAGFNKMIENYRNMVNSAHSQAAFHKLLELLANTNTGATIYHCSEGKDRTGMATIFILYLLGVDLESIRQDYLLSNYMLNDYRKLRDEQSQAKGASVSLRANLRSLGGVRDEYFDAALLEIEKYGGFDRYLQEMLHVSDDLKLALREQYLEEV